MCRKTGKIIFGLEIRIKEHNNELDISGIIDRMAGVTTLERNAIEMKDAVADGPKTVMLELRVGSYGAFKFGEDASYNTIHTRKNDEKSTCETFLVDEQSMFTMETNDADGMKIDEMEANMRAEEHRVEVDFGDLMNLWGY